MQSCVSTPGLEVLLLPLTPTNAAMDEVRKVLSLESPATSLLKTFNRVTADIGDPQIELTRRKLEYSLRLATLADRAVTELTTDGD